MDTATSKRHIPHPRASANVLSAATFSWMFSTFQKGFKRDLEVEDLYSTLDEHRSDYLGDKIQRAWETELKESTIRNKCPSLLRSLVKCFGFKTILYGVLIAITEFFTKVSQPLFMGGLIRYFSADSNMELHTAFLYAGAIAICSALNVITRQTYMMAIFHMGMKIRVSLCSLLYRKTLRLSRTALRETTTGQAVNLLSNDVNRFDSCLLLLVYLWFGPLQTLVVLYLIWIEIDFAAVIGVAIIILGIPLEVYMGKMLSAVRLRTAKRTDERIRLMNEIIVGIQVIKMYAWEKPFAHLVSNSRKREMKAIRAASFIRAFLLSFEKFTTRIAIFVAIVAYAALGNNITAEKVFVVTGFVNVINKAMTDFFPRSIAQIAEALVSVKRIQKFLLYDEVTIERINNVKNVDLNLFNANICDSDDMSKVENIIALQDNLESVKNKTSVESFKGIKVTKISARWTDDIPTNTLENVNLDVLPGELVAIIGPVGSGKSSLLHAVLKELPLSSGSISVRGVISYASQEPWLFTGSVKQNILFGQSLDKDRYRRVVKVCALERDLQLLPYGDKTIVGERGATLSGGQRARINLARTVYKQADIYILDDPLSAVDTHVGRHLFDDCICDFLQDKARVLVTHQLQYLQKADKILILNNGQVEATGTHTELHDLGVNFSKQLEEGDGDTHRPRHDSTSSFKRVKRQSSQLSQHSSVDEFEPMQKAEMQTRGKIRSGVYSAFFNAGANCSGTLLMCVLFILAQFLGSVGDYWMSFWTSVEERRSMVSDENSTIIDTVANYTSTQFLSTDNTTMVPPTVTEWNWMPSTETCIYIYTGFVTGIVVLTIGSSLFFFSVCIRASINLHNSMFTSITRATLKFFTDNTSGQILNRFAKDMGSIDEILPQTMMDCIQRFLMIIGVIAVVGVVNYWLLIPTVVMIVIFYMLHAYYIPTSRSIKRLEAITRSPVFSHLNASLQGLTTIRAFGTQALLEKEFDNQQDLHSTAFYLFLGANRAFGLWLDIICVVYIALVSFSFLVMGGDYYGGDVGLAITQAIGLTGMLQLAVRQTAELQNQMTSVERVVEYTDVESEPPLESPTSFNIPKYWPSKGEITFNNVSLGYSSEEPPVLRNVSFTTESAEKIGIVGRTGAGKSSLITALFRLVDPYSGSINIDGVNILELGLHDLRSKISIIPQEPALFSGLLRENLDPFNEFSDSVIWSALEEVELKQIVDELPAGLNHVVSEGASNFSVGQRQLLCLARAIIRNNKILVLDEATANVDPQTDELIQATIRQKFVDCTVLTIAHRLHTIIDSDRIIVMDAGSVVEFHHPYLLLKNKKGYFYQLVQETGHTMAESLLKTAQKKYES